MLLFSINKYGQTTVPEVTTYSGSESSLNHRSSFFFVRLFRLSTKGHIGLQSLLVLTHSLRPLLLSQRRQTFTLLWKRVPQQTREWKESRREPYNDLNNKNSTNQSGRVVDDLKSPFIGSSTIVETKKYDYFALC